MSTQGTDGPSWILGGGLLALAAVVGGAAKASTNVTSAQINAVKMNALFHGSYDPLPTGVTIKAKKTDRQSSTIERYVDRFRPPSASPRWESWYMVDDPCKIEKAGGNAKHIYEVRPTTTPTPANFKQIEDFWARWLKIASETGLTPTVKEFASPETATRARRYWANEPTSEGRQTEWLAPEVEIVRAVRCRGGQEGRIKKRRFARKEPEQTLERRGRKLRTE